MAAVCQVATTVGIVLTLPLETGNFARRTDPKSVLATSTFIALTQDRRSFDFIYIDADKRNAAQQYDFVCPDVVHGDSGVSLANSPFAGTRAQGLLTEQEKRYQRHFMCGGTLFAHRGPRRLVLGSIDYIYNISVSAHRLTNQLPSIDYIYIISVSIHAQILHHGLLRPQGIIAVDNTLRGCGSERGVATRGSREVKTALRNEVVRRVMNDFNTYV